VPFVEAFIDAVDGARADLVDFKTTWPDWLPSWSNRTLANVIHDRTWDRLVKAVSGLPHVEVIDREPTREIYHGTQYAIRIKRHHPGERISTYPTATAIAFWTNGAPALPEMELVSLALGYRWDADTRSVGEAVLSFRDQVDHPIWAIELHRPAGGVLPFAWTPISPDLPELDLSGVAAATEEEASS
jgi:hypothetical protein